MGLPGLIVAAGAVLVFLVGLPVGTDGNADFNFSGECLFQCFVLLAIALGAGIAAVKRWVRG